MSRRTLELLITAKNKTRKVLATVRGGLKTLRTVGKKATDALRRGFKAVGTAISAATGFVKTAVKWFLILAALPALIFISAVRQAAAFEQSMANVKSVLGGTAEEMKRVSMAAREMGKTSVFTAQEAASAMYDLASAGFSADQVIDSLKGTMLLAAATGSDLTFTTETMTSVLKQFSLQSKDADRVANTFAATISFSKMNMDRLSTSMSFAGPVAAAFGHSLEGTLSVLAQFANMGLRASMIGTTFRMGLLQLSKAMPIEQIEKGADVLKRLNIQFMDIDPSMHSVADIVERLHGKVTKMTEAVALFGVRAGGPWLKLITEGAEPLRVLEAKITGTRKAFEMSATQIMTFNGRLRIFKSAIQEAQISLGTAFLPVLTDIVDRFIGWVSIINQINWTEFFHGFQSGATEGAKKIDAILALFRSGGPLRQAVRAWGFFFLDTVSGIAKIIWIPLETEFRIAILKMAKVAKETLAEAVPVIGPTTALMKFVAKRVEGPDIGPEVQERMRETARQRMAGQAKRLLGRRPREAIERTTELAEAAREAFAGIPKRAPEQLTTALQENTNVVKEEARAQDILSRTVVDALGETHTVYANSISALFDEIRRVQSVMGQLDAKVKMAMSDGTLSVGAVE